MKQLFNIVLFMLTGKGPIGESAVNDDIISYEGQGRDKYGK